MRWTPACPSSRSSSYPAEGRPPPFSTWRGAPLKLVALSPELQKAARASWLPPCPLPGPALFAGPSAGGPSELWWASCGPDRWSLPSPFFSTGLATISSRRRGWRCAGVRIHFASIHTGLRPRSGGVGSVQQLALLDYRPFYNSSRWISMRCATYRPNTLGSRRRPTRRRHLAKYSRREASQDTIARRGLILAKLHLLKTRAAATTI